MVTAKGNRKQNVTIRLDRRIIEKAKILAARRSTSLSALLAHRIELLVGEEVSYERAKKQALILLDHGFHLGGKNPANRNKLHER